MIDRWEKLFWHHLQRADPGSDSQKFWLDGYVHLSRSAEAQRNLLQLMNMEIKRKWMQEITHPQSSLSLARLKAAMGSLYPVDQVNFRDALGEIFFEHLPHQGMKRRGPPWKSCKRGFEA